MLTTHSPLILSFILRSAKNHYLNFVLFNSFILIISNPDEEEIDEEFNENAIPDFEERKRKADLVDELTLGEQEEDDYTTERQVYSMEDSVSGSVYLMEDF